MATRAILATKIIKIFPGEHSLGPPRWVRHCHTCMPLVYLSKVILQKILRVFFLTRDPSSPCHGHKVNGIIVVIGLAPQFMPCKEYRLS